MKLNPNSWHARWYTWRGDNLPYNLCTYMWGLLFCTLWRLFIATFYLFVAVLMINVIIKNPHAAAIFLLSVIALIGGVLFLSWLLESDFNFIFLTKDFLRAKKEKYCPMIEWKDEQ